MKNNLKTIELNPTKEISWRQTTETNIKGKKIICRVFNKKPCK